ncbi:hypothetical protein RCCGEPOP_09599 [Rhizobium sp. Pop5]|nr:hypothetical protein RCCGEPOP_09599 [Rhizobium sp. Pop5]
MSLSGFNGRPDDEGNAVFPAGEGGQRMHIRAACLLRTPVFGENGATTRTYGADPCTEFGDDGEKRRLPGKRDRAVGGI